VPDVISDGREVYAEPVNLLAGVIIAYETEFRLEDTEPNQLGV